MRVFVSHSSRDRWIARQLDKELRAIASVETFLDERNIAGGDRITDSVRAEIKRCDEMVVIFSSASQESDWVKAEIGAGWGLEKRIIVLLDKLSPKDVPQIVADYKAFDLNDTEDYLKDVRGRTGNA